MHIIADSSSSSTRWAIVDGNRIVQSADTSGLNPFFMTRREISHIIRLELPQDFFRRRWDHVYFYGAGCSSPEKIKLVESSLIAQFKTPTSVMSNLMGAARAMLNHSPGLVAVLSTGANSCYYDGKNIVKNIRAGGYILGDEGSNAYLGKLLISDIFKGITPHQLISRFYERFSTNAEEIMDLVYSHPQASLTLARYATFLAENIDHAYCQEQVYNALMQFFRRNMSFYDIGTYPVSFVGSVGITYPDILQRAAKDFGVVISNIAPNSLPGLVDYHSTGIQ